jgi:hypothetical protein
LQVANVNDPAQKDRAQGQYSQRPEINGQYEAILVQSGSSNQCRRARATGRDRCGGAERGRGIRLRGRRDLAIPTDPGPDNGRFRGCQHTGLAYVLFTAFLAHFGAALYHGLVRRDGAFGSMASWQ